MIQLCINKVKQTHFFNHAEKHHPHDFSSYGLALTLSMMVYLKNSINFSWCTATDTFPLFKSNK